MQRSTLPTGVKSLMGWRDKGILTFDNPVQRAGSQWNLLQKSLLIHSMLANYPIPAIYLLKNKRENDGVTEYDCLDSKQRLTSVFDFITGEYALHSATPPVEVDGFIFDLANLKFEDLSDECKDIITGYRFSINCIEDATEEEVEEIFKRLNNSTPLSAIQKARTVMGSDLARWCKEVVAMDFFTHSINLTVAQLRREADLEVLLQSMLLISSRDDAYTDWKGISTGDVTKFCGFIRGNYDDDKRVDLMCAIDYLGDAFTEQHKFLKKSNIPTIILLGKIAMENDIEAEEFKRFIDYFSNCICPEYDENCGSGNVKRSKTEGRLLAIAKRFEEYFEIDTINILGDEVVPAEKTVEETVEEPIEEENEELVEELGSSDGSDEESEEIPEENTIEEEVVEDVSEENTELSDED